MTAGPRGPILLQDIHLIDKMAKFDRERIPERVVHAKGAGAYGYFEVTHDVTKYAIIIFYTQLGLLKQSSSIKSQRELRFSKDFQL